MTLLMLDLCAGLKGASEAMRLRGWEVVTLDYDPRFACTFTADLREWSWRGRRPDLIWASVPCDEFARESMPWCKTGAPPDLSLWCAAQRIIREEAPRYHCIENVRGAQRWTGTSQQHIGPFHLWTNLPYLSVDMRAFRKKESYSSTQRAERAKIPYALSLAVAIAVESQGELWSLRDAA